MLNIEARAASIDTTAGITFLYIFSPKNLRPIDRLRRQRHVKRKLQIPKVNKLQEVNNVITK